VGAEECRRELGIADEDVLDAIRFHTTGRRDWSAVGCALYLADFAEPLRTIPAAGKTREILAAEGYRSALRYAAAEKEHYVRKKFEPDANTIAFFEWIGKSG
jgi:HD superfamily phosphohydrolase YqeK